MWEAAKPLRLSAEERELLEGFSRAGSAPQKIGLRIRIVLRSADARLPARSDIVTKR